MNAYGKKKNAMDFHRIFLFPVGIIRVLRASVLGQPERKSRGWLLRG